LEEHTSDWSSEVCSSDLIARDSNELSPETRDELAKLRSDAGELASLLGELLDLARLDAGQAALRSEPIAVGELAQDIVEQMTSLAHERGIELTARGAETFARGDLARMRQVLRVLIDNALAHTERGGRVLVEASHAGARALVSVTDNGEGIAPEHLPHIFERFYRADAARSKGGAGLGLAIASELVRLMNGELRVESERGKRTTFVVELPAPEA
jgi:signal transduction histidine kinase